MILAGCATMNLEEVAGWVGCLPAVDNTDAGDMLKECLVERSMILGDIGRVTRQTIDLGQYRSDLLSCRQNTVISHDETRSNLGVNVA